MSEIDKGAEEPVVNESGMDESEVSEIPSVSRILQETRESLGLTRKDIADQLFLAEKQIDSIEEEKFDNFPKKIFVKGYLRSYARIVGLSGEDIVKLYEAAYETRAEEAVEEKIAHQKEIELLASRKIIRTGLISLVILIILMLLLWLLVGNDEPERAAEEGETGSMVDAPVLQVDDGSLDADISLETGQTTGAGVAEPETIEHAAVETEVVETERDEVTAVESAVDEGHVPGMAAMDAALEDERSEVVLVTEEPLDGSEAEKMEDDAARIAYARSLVIEKVRERDEEYMLLKAGGDQEISLGFLDECWVEVTDGEAALIYADLNRQGDVLKIYGKPPFKVLLGNGAAAEITFNGEPVDFSNRIRSDKTARIQLGN